MRSPCAVDGCAGRWLQLRRLLSCARRQQLELGTHALLYTCNLPGATAWVCVRRTNAASAAQATQTREAHSHLNMRDASSPSTQLARHLNGCARQRSVTHARAGLHRFLRASLWCGCLRASQTCGIRTHSWINLSKNRRAACRLQQRREKLMTTKRTVGSVPAHQHVQIDNPRYGTNGAEAQLWPSGTRPIRGLDLQCFGVFGRSVSARGRKVPCIRTGPSCYAWPRTIQRNVRATSTSVARYDPFHIADLIWRLTLIASLQQDNIGVAMRVRSHQAPSARPVNASCSGKPPHTSQWEAPVRVH